MSIKNVAVIGGSGNLGPAIVNSLLDAGFTVTTLSRESSTKTFPVGVIVKKVNYDDLSTVSAALQGQDAVVSTIAAPGIKSQKAIVDTAIKAGVKRFIPSEFGINTRTVTGPIGQLLAGKVATVDYLMEKAKENPGFSWTGLANSLFFDWGLAVGGMGFKADTKTATIYDSGNEIFSATSLPYIGKAIASILKHPEETANKYLCIAGFNTSQNQLLAIIEEITGEKWAVEKVSTADLKKSGEQLCAQGNPAAFRDLIKVYSYQDGAGHSFKQGDLANDLLELPKEDLRATVKAWLVKTGLVSG